MTPYPIISSDDHTIEPPELWRERIDSPFKDRAPHLVSEDDADWWYADGYKMISVEAGVQVGEGLHTPERVTRRARWDDVRKGGFMPDDRIKEMDLDGVYGQVLYPTTGLRFFNLPDGKLLSAIFRAYNDWAAEFCNAQPSRLKGIAMVNVDDIPEGIEELERCRRMGLVGAMISVHPAEELSYERPLYDPFWAAAQDLDMPLSLHTGTSRVIPHSTSPFRDVSGIRTALLTFTQRVVHRSGWVEESLTNMIFAGVLERYPRLKVGSVEHDVGWAPHWVWTMDKFYHVFSGAFGWKRLKAGALPSDYVKSNMFFSCQDDRLGVEHRDSIGVDTLLWGSDYPHQDSTFPNSRQVLDDVLAGVPEDERAKIAGSSTAKLYGFEV